MKMSDIRALVVFRGVDTSGGAQNIAVTSTPTILAGDEILSVGYISGGGDGTASFASTIPSDGHITQLAGLGANGGTYVAVILKNPR